jgi:enterochelin esterase family protein
MSFGKRVTAFAAIAVSVVILLPICAFAQQAQQGDPTHQPAQPAANAGRGRGRGQTPQVLSPEVMPDRRITFRIFAAQAQNVRVSGTDIPVLAGGGRGARANPNSPNPGDMKKAENGVWEAVIGPVPPGSYRYNFNVDGVSVIDPRNPLTSESNDNTWSLVHVPGADFMDTKAVPHGGVAALTYYSDSLGKFRRLHIYTPPGYESGRERFPVLYLMHGAGDSDDSWTSVGRAGFILDNLIAAKKAKPMIVVMTAGHTARGGSQDKFTDDFVKDMMPFIEKTYRVANGRNDRAIAGLSMGGSQTLDISFDNLDKFAYIGVFSSGANLTGGAQGTSWDKAHQAALNDANLKKGLKLLWLSTGADDFVLPNTRATVEMLKKSGLNPVYKEGAGGHTWLNWREYLNEFAPQLFR